MGSMARCRCATRSIHREEVYAFHNSYGFHWGVIEVKWDAGEGHGLIMIQFEGALSPRYRESINLGRHQLRGGYTQQGNSPNGASFETKTGFCLFISLVQFYRWEAAFFLM
eukprot:Gb_24910 [translate_table: standard]